MTVIYLPEGCVDTGRPVSTQQVITSATLVQPSAAQAFRVLEGIEALWRTSSLHAGAPSSFLLASAMPPILLNQYLLVLEQGSQKPLGLCTWAAMDLETEYRYLLEPTALQRTDWCSGDRLWLIDWIGTHAINRLMARWLKTRALPTRVLRTLRVHPPATQGSILSFVGAQIDPDTARHLLQSYHDDYTRTRRAATGSSTDRR